MTAAEIAREASRLPAPDRRQIIAKLVMQNLREDETEWAEIERRMNDRNPKNWVSLDEAINHLPQKDTQ